MELLKTCEAGKYFSSGETVVFLSWSDMEEDLILRKMKSRFTSDWPAKWEEIRTSIPEGPFEFRSSPPLKGNKLIEDLADLYFLTKADLLFAGFGVKTAENLLRSIGKSKSQPLEKVVYSLGIRHIGRENAKVLADKFGSLDALGRATWIDIILIDGVSAAIGASILDYFHTEGSWRNIEKMRLGGLDYAFGYSSKKEDFAPSPIRGKVFMFTGRLCMPRTAAQEKVESLGGIAGSTVSPHTDYLVVGEKPGSKLGKAVALGIRRLPEEDFWTLLGGNR